MESIVLGLPSCRELVLIGGNDLRGDEDADLRPSSASNLMDGHRQFGCVGKYLLCEFGAADEQVR